jgi:hypothetical protein
MSAAQPGSSQMPARKAMLVSPTITIDPNGYTDANNNPMSQPLTSPFKVWGDLTPSGLTGSLNVQLFYNNRLVGTWDGDVADRWFVLVTYSTGTTLTYKLVANYDSGTGDTATDNVNVQIQ